jgi:dihydropyrimidinase
MFDLVIQHGTVIDPAGLVNADVGINGGRVAAIGLGLEGRETLDATGCYVLPGAVDPHVHLQMALGGRVSSDSFITGTIAAACGGTTTVVDFVDPQPEQTLLEALAQRRLVADGQVAVDYGLHMTVPAWHAADPGRLEEVVEVVAAGCATFKLYQAYPGVMLDDVALFRVMQTVARAGGRVVLHAETGPVLDLLRSQALAAGETAPIWHMLTRPARLEATAIHRAAELAHLAGCPLHVFHVGCAEGVGEVRAAQCRGVAVTAETCPQYLLLTADEHLGGADGKLYICAPPLRGVADQEALWSGLADGAVAMVSTDHCPWSAEEKNQPDFAQVPGGVPSIEGRLALVYHFGVGRGRLSLQAWVESCCTAPAQVMGLTRKGRLAPGYDADVVIFDPQRSRTLSHATLHEAAGWTPYEGLSIQGWPRTVLVRGRVVVQDEEFVGELAGCFVERCFDGE